MCGVGVGAAGGHISMAKQLVQLLTQQLLHLHRHLDLALWRLPGIVLFYPLPASSPALMHSGPGAGRAGSSGPGRLILPFAGTMGDGGEEPGLLSWKSS